MVVIVEDTTTTGGSSLKAIEKAEAAGLKVSGVISIVDRLAGASEIFAERGYPLRAWVSQTLRGLDDRGVRGRTRRNGVHYASRSR